MATASRGDMNQNTNKTAAGEVNESLLEPQRYILCEAERTPQQLS
ncbi:MAG TPA: hypothetical protein VJU86_19520 [Pyrinomonadaceae bacterium]|nr:hypothetical protein [Pyrinomonadaceae bacterium]